MACVGGGDVEHAWGACYLRGLVTCTAPSSMLLPLTAWQSAVFP